MYVQLNNSLICLLEQAIKMPHSLFWVNPEHFVDIHNWGLGVVFADTLDAEKYGLSEGQPKASKASKSQKPPKSYKASKDLDNLDDNPQSPSLHFDDSQLRINVRDKYIVTMRDVAPKYFQLRINDDIIPLWSHFIVGSAVHFAIGLVAYHRCKTNLGAELAEYIENGFTEARLLELITGDLARLGPQAVASFSRILSNGIDETKDHTLLRDWSDLAVVQLGPQCFTPFHSCELTVLKQMWILPMTRTRKMVLLLMGTRTGIAVTAARSQTTVTVTATLKTMTETEY